jgi:hypothetical protein
LQHIKNESNVGKEEFSHIAEDEKKRVLQVVEKENERIMQEMRENGKCAQFALKRFLLFNLMKNASEERAC